MAITDEDQKNQIFENKFWLRIMQDHLYIFLNALNFNETEERSRAQTLIKSYNNLLARIWDTLTEEQLKKINEEAYKATEETRKYQLHLLYRQLMGNIGIAISSNLTSRLTSEAECYLDILFLFLQDKKYVIQPIALHQLWLFDAAGHAEDIANGLNFSDADLKSRTFLYQKEFITLYIRAHDMKGFFRIGVNDFPAFDQFNEDVNSQLTDFTEFFVELNFKIIKGKVPTTVTPIMLDHMYREECYYLTQLSKISNIRPPVCDPTVEGFELPKAEPPR
jgi:hypothetical protein